MNIYLVGSTPTSNAIAYSQVKYCKKNANLPNYLRYA